MWTRVWVVYEVDWHEFQYIHSVHTSEAAAKALCKPGGMSWAGPFNLDCPNG